MRTVRWVDALAALVVAALCAIACQNPLVAAIPAAITVVAALVSRDGLRADVNAQLAASLVSGALPAYLATNVLERSPPFGVLEPVPGATVVGLLGAAAVRPAFALGRNSGLANSGLLLCAMITAGQARIGPVFVVLCAVAATLSLTARGLERKPNNGTGPIVGRDARALAATALFAACVTSVAGWGLPIAHQWAMRRMFNRFDLGRAESGLSDRMSLSSMDGVLQSDTEVLRVRGERTDYLRGAVFDRYRLGSWSYSGSTIKTPVRFEQRARGLQAGETEIRRVGGPSGWMFVPLDTARFATSEAQVDALPSGVLRTSGDADVLWFRGGTPRAVAIAEPTAIDREVPRVLRPTLVSLVQAWGCAAGEPEARVRCIEQRLRREYQYSLNVPESTRREPLAAFLTRHRRGHCEYFASALALLARTADVPARVVAGYRVSERSEWGDYWTVRERNAHSWVEAHVGERGWTRFDATPAAQEEIVAHQRVARWRAALEALRWRVVDAFDQVKSRGLLPWFIGALALVLGASVGRRSIRGLFASRRRTSDADAAPKELSLLLKALERFGVRREKSETLERFAERISSSALPDAIAVEARDALREYARERYGGELSDSKRRTLAELSARIRGAARPSKQR